MRKCFSPYAPTTGGPRRQPLLSAMLAGLGLLLCQTLQGQEIVSSETEKAPSLDTSAVRREFMEKLGAGAIAPNFDPSALPGDIGKGTRYTQGGIVWAPTPAAIRPPLLEATDGLVVNYDPTLFINITNAPAAVGTNALTDGVTLSGSHAGTVGNLWVYNRANHTTEFFAPQTGISWIANPTNLVIGMNRIGVYGESPTGDIVSDGVVIWVGERYTSVPAVKLTDPDFVTLPYENTSLTLEGSNNEHVRGEIEWHNARNWQTGPVATGITGEASWSFTVTNLDVGLNPVYVFASNRYGDVTYDLVSVIRTQRPDAALVRITNAPSILVSSTPENVIISGIHSNIVGSLWWSVRETHGVSFFTPAPDGRWITSVDVSPGTNTITVYGLDPAGEYDSDVTTVLVGGEELLYPADITITTPDPLVLPFFTTSAGITASTVVDRVQSVIWTNADAAVGGTMVPGPGPDEVSGDVVGLAPGLNEVYVVLVDKYGDTDYDQMTIVRSPAEDLPAIEVTDYAVSVPPEISQARVSGTNNPHVIGSILWSNMVSGTRGAIPVQGPAWSGAVDGLVPGNNLILLTGSNEWGALAHDLITIERERCGDAPVVVITHDVPSTVPYPVDGVVIEGTNNGAVVGNMWWINADGGASGLVDRATATMWKADAFGLVPGMNVIYVGGSNECGRSTLTTVSVYRERSPGAPIVAITNAPPAELPPGTDFLVLQGTNNSFVTGDMWWVNLSASATGVVERTELTWQGLVTHLVNGANVIYVFGTDAFGHWGADVVTVDRLRPGGYPVIDITNAPPASLPHTVQTARIEGTNSPDIVGYLEWRNGTAGTAGDIPVQPDGRWTVDLDGLVHGENWIYIIGVDAYGNEANDVASISRDFPPGIRYVSLTGTPVPPYTNWPTAARTIQDAIDAAFEGDHVLVAEGEYASGSQFILGEQTQNRLVIDKNVSVMSVGGPDATIIHGEWDGALNAVRGVRVLAGGSLRGFTIAGGRAEPFMSPNDGNGGGILASGGEVAECRILGNHASSRGGGISAGNALVTDCLVISNTATMGGGIHAVDTMVSRAHVLDNHVTGPGELAIGGGILAEQNSSVINSVVAQNTAEGHGGGAAIGGNALLEHVTVADNKARSRGGGVFAVSPAVVLHSIFFGDAAATEEEAEFAGDGLLVSECLLPFAYPGNEPGIPAFTDPAAYNYSLLPGSPGIDMLATATLSSDIENLPRPLDGDESGTAEADAGAYELLDPDADSDGDGMRDRWELDHELDPTSAVGRNGGDEDNDDDGLNNRGEFIADTHPLDPNSTFVILSISNSPALSVLEWHSSSNRYYTMDSCSDLFSRAWIPVDGLTNMPGSGTNQSAAAPHDGFAGLFYRLRAKLQPTPEQTR